MDRRIAKAENKKKDMIKQQRLNIEDVSDEEIIDNRDLMETKPTKAYVDGHDNESSGDSSDSDDSEVGAKFVNPLL